MARCRRVGTRLLGRVVQLRECGTAAGRRLPYIENFVNLIVVSDECRVPRDELLRVLAPKGVAIVGGEKVVKPRLQEIDDWTH